MVLHKGYSLDHVITYTSLINWLCNLGHWDEVRKMLKEMDVQTHFVLVDAFCKEGKLEEAEDVMNIMVEVGKVPDRVTYKSLIDSYCQRGDLIKAIAIVDSMVSRNILPNGVTFNIVNNGHCKSLNIKKAMLMFDEMTKKGLKLKVVTEIIMRQGLLQVGNQEVVARLRSKCEVPDEHIARMDLGY
ncbi:hypothetical protein QVD17_13195 [Tagetes erecta]|uniref:Pentatricopeptide repeat-containing protein n=1 Tax=Tagetes erecta TaxID=13708 RepID=A0AAD8P3A4_TARER|nr:hypothetical protein QVD17_13195 [Tagetes erecta]